MSGWRTNAAMALAVAGLLGCDGEVACGNGTLDEGERCDAADLGGASCASEGLGSGTLRCAPTCDAFDASECEAPLGCGDGVAVSPEVCDGADLGGATCASLGFGDGALACGDGCLAHDTSGCGAPVGCGDGVIDDGEVCDGDAFDTTCEDQGYGPGALRCDRCMAVVTDDCACEDRACEDAGAECGEIFDGCGGRLECGACRLAYETCGAIAPNACDAVCTLSCPGGEACDDAGLCTADGELVLDVATVELVGTLVRGGATPALPEVCAEEPDRILARVQLTPVDPLLGGGTNLTLRCRDGFAFGPARIAPGRYSVRAAGEDAASGLPVLYGPVTEVVVDGSPLTVEVVGHRVSGVVIVGGLPIVERSSCVAPVVAGRLELRSTERPSERIEALIPCGAGGAFELLAAPGRYDVYVFPGASDIPSPRPGSLPLPRALGLVVAGPLDGLVFDAAAEPEGATVRGRVTFRGATPTPTAACNPGLPGAAGGITFASEGADHSASFECDSDWTFAVAVPPGVYEVSVTTQLTPNATVPRSVSYRAGRVAVGADGEIRLDVDVPLYEVSGRITVAGTTPDEVAPCPDGEQIGVVQSATFSAFDAVFCGDELRFGPITLVGGRQSLEVRASGARTELVYPTGVRIPVDVRDDTDDLVLDLPAPARVSGRIQVDGATPETTAECVSPVRAGTVTRSVVTGDSTLIAGDAISCDTDWTYAVTVPTGATLGLRVSGDAGSTLPPVSAFGFDPFVVEGDATRDANVAVRALSGRVTLDGVAPVEGECVDGDRVARVFFRDIRFGFPFATTTFTDVTCGSGFAFGPVSLPVGVYRVSVAGIFGRSSLPTGETTVVEHLAVR